LVGQVQASHSQLGWRVRVKWGDNWMISAMRGLLTGGLYFNGRDNYVKTPSFDVKTRTISAWVMRLGDGSSEQNPIAFHGSDLCFTGYTIRLKHQSMGYFGVGVNTVVRERWYSNIAPFPLNQWFHAVVTYDDVALKFYLNGRLAWSVTLNEAILDRPADPFWVGGETVRNMYFAGIIDKVAFWNRALTDSEISDIYNKAIYPRDGLVLLLDFTEYEGTTAYDKSGLGNHGTIYGAKWVIKKAKRVLST